MEFYKIFKLLHHRTDWFRLWRWQREIMMPEWYEEKDRLAEQALRRFSTMRSIISNVYSKDERINFYG